MKITKLKVTPLRQRALLLRMYTDEGIVGYGEPMNYEHGRVVAQAIEDMGEYLIGKDPCQIEDHWQAIFRSSYSRQMPILLSALSGLEQAMWDIMGKWLNVPIWQLLGGACRQRIRVYGSAGGRTPEECAKNARARVDQGFTAIKTTPFSKAVRYIDTPDVVDEIVAKVGAMRDAVGKGVDLAVDFHRVLSPAMSIVVLKELEPFRLLFVEEPCHPENVDALVTIARSTSTPIATGERNTTRWGFREIIEKKAAAVLQPDIRHAGGISEMRKIASLAEIHYIALAPHSASGPVGVAASIQAMAATPNFLIQEFGGGAGDGLFKEPLSFRDGYIDLPMGPGLGIELDEAGIEANTHTEYRFRNMWRHEDDGSVADI